MLHETPWLNKLVDRCIQCWWMIVSFSFPCRMLWMQSCNGRAMCIGEHFLVFHLLLCNPGQLLVTSYTDDQQLG